jgi:IS605 OrfB family transposase
METQTNLKTLKVRVKDKHSKILNQMAFEVNQIWNAVNAETDELGWIPVPEVGWISGGELSAFDLQKQFKTIRKERGLSLPSHTVQETIAVHAKARKQFKKNKLRWRVSGGSRRNLGWIPFKSGQLVYRNGQCKFNGSFFGVWDSYGLSEFGFRSGSFSEDSRGRWYLNIVVEVKSKPSYGAGQVGIDLGLKTTATCSDGTTLERANIYRNAEQKLGIAQRANNKNRVKAIHAKIKNKRADTLHKFSKKLVEENSLIVVGNVSSKGLAKTKMAKSVLDAGWQTLKTQLDYKSKAMQVVFEEVNERYTTQMCSCCGEISANSPKGRADLGIREWTCVCGTTHDRDINAAKNILALGHERLAVGIADPLGR